MFQIHSHALAKKRGKNYVYLFLVYFISPLFNQVGQLRTSSHLQLRPDQNKAKQCDKNNTDEQQTPVLISCWNNITQNQGKVSHKTDFE